MTVHVAFKAHGLFAWPPLPQPGTGEAPGTAAILFAEDGDRLAAYLQWIPGEAGIGADAPPPETLLAAPSLGEMDSTTLASALADPTQGRLFRLGPLAGSGPFVSQRRLLFRGVCVLDQYRIDGERMQDQAGGVGRKRRPDLRWLLARTYNVGSERHHSELFVGVAGDTRATGTGFGFNLALPTPAAQMVKVISGPENDIASYAFPFRATYRPTLETGLKLVPIQKLGAGPDNSVDYHEPEIALPTVLASKHLGGFGFAKSDGGETYFQVPRSGNAGKRWLEHAEVYQTDVIERVFSVHRDLDQRYVFDTPGNLDESEGNEGEFWNSIGFDWSEAGRTAIKFRSAVFLKADAESLTSGQLGIYQTTGGQRHFLLADPLRPRRNIQTGSGSLLVDLELKYSLRDEQVWEEIRAPGKLKAEIEVRFGFTAPLPATALNPNPFATVRPNDDIGWTGLLAEAVAAMRLARLNLRNLDPAQPQSILADLEIAEPRTVRFALCATFPARFLAPATSVGRGIRLLGWGRGARFGAPTPLRLTIWPEDTLGASVGDRAVAAKVRFALPSFCYEGGTPGEAELRHDPAVHRRDSTHFAGFRLDVTRAPGAKARLGGLEFTSSSEPAAGDDDADYGYLRFGPRTLSVPPKEELDAPFAYPATEVDLRLRYRLERVEPVGTDIPRDSRSPAPRPILVNTSSSRGRFRLDIRETVSVRGDRRLQASISDIGAGSPGKSGEFVLLSEQPFSVVRFVSRPLQDRGDAGGTEVANYDSDGRVWKVKQIQDFYKYEFPPQVVGESMDRPRRLEIVDIDPDRPRPHPPYALNAGGAPAELDEGNQGVLRRTAVEFRLSPSTEAWVRPSDVERGYFLPEWATHELFRQSGAFGLGAALAGFRGEFLYGLPVGVDTSLEEGPPRGARIAEMEALLGRPLDEPRSANPDPELTGRWKALSGSIAGRPERLEMWMRDPASARPFIPARFERSARFALRETAVLRSPFGDPPAGSVYGLAGGALWPLESKNFYERLRERPDSSGGTIERVAISPTGGDADQRAEFLNGQVAIISETRNGHVQRHRVEIIGRISVFWHRAKHVVIYERTTSSSAQFAPEDNQPRTRRPVLRKISEYIELLQPVRTYPDFAAASRQTTGFLRAVRFNSAVINVDSAWSEDLDKYGWRIPLWNRDSARKRPSVYPRPDIAFVTAAEGEGEQPVVAQECLDPDNIYFFADADAGNADTDSWFARIGIDCADLPAPAHRHQPEPATDGGERQPNAQRIPRGYRRFTWRLAPAARKTAINAERGDEALFAGLETITFMRASAAEQQDAAGLEIEKALADAAKPVEMPRAKLQPIADAKAAFEAAVGLGDEQGIVARARELVDRLREPDQQAWRYIDPTNKLHERVNVMSGRCERMVEDFTSSLQRKKLLLLERLRDSTADWRKTLPPLNMEFNSYEALIGSITNRLMEALQPALAGAGEDIGRLEASVEKARGIIRDFEDEVVATIAKARRKKDEVVASYDRAKPWSPARIDEYQRRIAAVRDGIRGDVDTALLEIQSRLGTELDSVAGLIAKNVGAALQMAADANGGLRDTLGRAETAATAFVRRLQAAIGDRIAAMAKAVEALAELDTNGAHADAVRALRGRLARFVADAQAGQERLARLAARLEQTAGAFDAGLAALGSALPAIQEEAGRLIADGRTEIDRFVETKFEAARTAARGTLDAIAGELSGPLAATAEAAGKYPEWLVTALNDRLDKLAASASGLTGEAFKAVNDAHVLISGHLRTLRQAVSPVEVRRLVRDKVVVPVLQEIVPEAEFARFKTITEASREELRGRMDQALAAWERQLLALDQVASKEIDAIRATAQAVCGKLGTSLSKIAEQIEGAAGPLIDRARALAQHIENALGDIERLKALGQRIQDDFDTIRTGLSQSYAQATAYADRVFDEAGRIGSGGLAAAPNNILRLYAAAASAPSLPNLDFARERLGYYYKQLNDIIDTSPAEAWFGRLGDELKAMGLSLPFDKIGSGIVPKDLSSFDIGKVFRNFGGIDLSKMFKGISLPAGAKDAIKVSHAFDKKLFRAWVQIDIDVPLPGRKPLFTVGPFKLDFVNSRLVGMLRLEASKDTEQVEQTGRATLHTDIDAVVSGQSMVMLQKVAVNYDRASGLKVDLDPKNIRLNSSLRFIQDTLASLFPDQAGGLKIVKKGGIPVGVEHEFSLPPMSLMAGTSGVSNIQISNRFSLVAYPDFVISNRFALSRPDLPFLFSIFIIGGTGYVLVDCDYRPFRNELDVMVEAAAGGSAALGFSAGPVSGSVFVSLSIALSYRKRIGSGSGGGLTASLVLLIAGTVDVAGIVSAYMGLLLRMSYQENGQIDGVGTLSMSIRISRFFQIKVRQHVQRQLRGPRRAAAAPEAPRMDPDERARRLIEARG